MQFTSKKFEFVRRSKAVKHLIAAFPKAMEYFNESDRTAMAAKVTADGKIIRIFEDPNGKMISMVTSAVEYEDNLYLGSLSRNYVGKFQLTGK